MRLFEDISIILASASDRRAAILSQVEIDFKAVTTPFDEKSVELTGEPFEIAVESSYNKAMSVKDMYKDSIILAADTIVVYKDRIFGKPSDEEEARIMLEMLSGDSHDVITGFTILNNLTGKIEKGYEITKVCFDDISGLIDWYISTGEYFDKAGSYGIQGKGAVLVKKIEGCYFNVVGLPIHQVVKRIQKIM